MMIDPLRDKTVLVTGGTMGIGLASGLAFAAQGAHCILTYRWGSADEAEIRAQFAALSVHEPLIIEADVSHDEDTVRLMEEIRRRHDHLDVLVSNVAVAQAIQRMEDYEKRVLFKSLDYSAWPLFAYLRQAHQEFGRYPRYAIGISSVGSDNYLRNYDFVGACKAVLETLARYAATKLPGTNVNIVRPGFARTDSLRQVFGPEFEPFGNRCGLDPHATLPGEVAKTIVALCSGLLDGMNGQVLTVDQGFTFADTFSRIEIECGPDLPNLSP